MRKWCFLIIIVMYCCLIGCGKEKISTEFGEIIFDENDVFTTFDNKEFSYQDIQDKNITMINVWGTFCVECEKEMPDLIKINDTYIKQGVQVIGIVIDAMDSKGNVNNSKCAEATEILKKSDVNYINLIPSKDFKQNFLKDVQIVPMTFFVNNEGKQIGDVYYGSKSYEEWSEIIGKILG